MYDIPGIEDMVPSLWSPIKVAYDRHAIWGTSHWGPKRQRFYEFASNIVSKHDVYSTKRIIAVTKVKVMKWYDYGYLDEIEVRRGYQQLYKFKEGNFPRLYLHDIKDMLLLLVQKKFSNLERDVIFDLGVALRMFTRHCFKPEDGLLTKENIEYLRQKEVLHHDQGYRLDVAREKVNEELGKVHW
ncbi:hypothetical protein Tco_0455252 [Tanacetum coccineum]